MSDLNDLNPVSQLDLMMPLAVIALGCLAAAIALVVLVIVLSRPRRRRVTTDRRGVHMDGNALARWRSEVDDIVRRHDEGTLSREDAFVELAEVARRFASVALGADVSASTLAELSLLPRTSGNQHSLDLLKQTIGALYPPEFADATLNPHANSVDVRQAAAWVSNLIERWR